MVHPQLAHQPQEWLGRHLRRTAAAGLAQWTIKNGEWTIRLSIFFFVLLTIDIGNTAMKFGVFDGETLVSKFVIPTRRDYTAAEIAAEISGRIPSGIEGS